MITTNQILTILKTKGYKQTNVRQTLIDYLVKTKKPSSALDLQRILETKLGKIHKTTVYRELEFLVQQQVLMEVYFADGKKRYEISGLPHHHHLVCNNCQKVEDIYPDLDLEKFETKIARKKSFTILHHSLEFFGLCQACTNC